MRTAPGTGLDTDTTDDAAGNDAADGGEPSSPGLSAIALAGVLRQARDENFPVASRLLPARARRDLLAVYGFARFVDDVGDEFAGDRLAALAEVAADVRRLPDREPRLPAVRALTAPVRAGAVPVEPLLRLVEANRQDQVVTRYPTWSDLQAYCALSADPVGELVLQVFGVARADRLVRSNAVCTALQLVEHLQDVGEDVARGRIYLPQEDLDRFGCPERDLGARATSPQLRAVVRYEVQRAGRLLAAGGPLVRSLRGWPRVAVAGYVAGGLAALDAITAVGFDVLGAATTPRPRRTARHATRLLLVGRAGVRRPT